jgi:hypothetical protein
MRLRAWPRVPAMRYSLRKSFLQTVNEHDPQGPSKMAVAHLGARFHGMEEVDGSNPSGSTKPFPLAPGANPAEQTQHRLPVYNQACPSAKHFT